MYERTFSGALGPYFSQIKEIAAGGNGRVLSGIDTRFDFPVCIKRISVSSKDECRAALREIRIRRRLRHENIVGLLNAIVSDGTEISEITPANFRETSCIYLVQELLDADLKQVIESNPRISDDYVKLFFYQLLRGMKYIHSANVLHRDLKPSNIMINISSLQLKIGDFGHSMVLDPEYSHGDSIAVCNTSQWYKAPELILGTHQYSTASDIWAVGCVLAEMLLGRPLFEGENDLEQLELIIHAIRVPSKDQTYIRSFLTDEVNTMYSGEPKFPLRSKFQKVDCQAFHLLEHLLSFDPDDRVTTEVALSHPFLTEFACVADEPVCLKPLHLEHEVDDFLEYTLKDLIVGECVALAEEQPRIHLQMSSCSSLNDLSKECHVSPPESVSQSMEERLSLELKTVSEEHHEEESNENECSRFKVLEVLKEEHGSSNESNGLAIHEERVSEEPLISDHPMYSSSKWEKERHKSGHRRHHHHRRKKKFHLKSPSSETEPSLDSNNAGGRTHEHTFDSKRKDHVSEEPENHVLSSHAEIFSPELPPLKESTAMVAQDDQVNDLIMRSRQLIADQATVVNEVPAITDICCNVTNSGLTDVCVSVPSLITGVRDCISTTTDINDVCNTVSSNYGRSKEFPAVHMEVDEEKPENISSSVGDLSVLGHHKSTVDLGVAEVIRRSQELLGEDCKSMIGEKTSVPHKMDRVQDLIMRSEELLKSQGVEIVQSNETMEDSPCVEYDRVQELIARSEQLLQSKEVMETITNRSKHSQEENCFMNGRVKNLSSTSEVEGENITEQPVNKQAIVKHCGSQFATEDKTYNGLDKCIDITTQPPANHHLPKDSIIHSSAKDNCPWLISRDHSHPGKNGENCRTAYEERCKEKANGEENFDKGLDGIDLNEMKSVLDQARKLLGQCNESNEENAKESLEKDTFANAMNVDPVVKGSASGEGDSTRIEVDQVEENTAKEVLTYFSCFPNRVDFTAATSEPLATSEQATVFEVKLIPPLEEQTTRYNCLKRSDGRSIIPSDGLEKCMIEKDDQTGDEYKQVLLKKRSNDTFVETNDSTHKHFKNNMTTTTVCEPVVETFNHGTDVVESEVHCSDYDNRIPRMNGFNADALDFNSDKRLIVDSKYKIDIAVSKNQLYENGYKSRKYSPKYEPTTIRRRRDFYSSPVIGHFNSDEVMDQICGSSCRMENNTRLNSNDSGGLHSFYTALKLKNIMRNQARSHRDKRHDTYPF